MHRAGLYKCLKYMSSQYNNYVSPISFEMLLKHFTGSPAAPSHLVHVKNSNTLTTATITWESVGNDVSYTVNSTSAGAPFFGITQTSYTLHDLEVETDYVVSVTATNECGIESPPSEEITVRIDVQGTMYNVHVHALFQYVRMRTNVSVSDLLWCNTIIVETKGFKNLNENT